MLVRFSLYGFLKNQRYFEPFMMLFLLGGGSGFATVGLLIGFRELCVNAFNLPAGAIADLYGRRRCLLASYLAYMASFLVFAFSAGRLAMLVPAVLLFAVGEAFREGTHKSMIFTWLRLNGRLADKTRVYGATRSWSKLGSAASIPIATAIAFLAGDLHLLFLAALVPYAIGFALLCTYPRALDGDVVRGVAPGQVLRHLWQTLRDCVRAPGPRRLMAESMGFEGFFDVVKDYVQPILMAVALGLPLLVQLGDERRGVLLIGAAYVCFHLGSAWSSRQAHRLSARCGGDAAASCCLWLALAGVYLAMLPCLACGLHALAMALFLLLFLLQGAWRPLIISRFDAVAPESRSTSILSVESQAQAAAKMVLAPLAGLAIDLASAGGGGLVGGRYWPLAAIGALIALAMLVQGRSRTFRAG